MLEFEGQEYFAECGLRNADVDHGYFAECGMQKKLAE